MADIRRLIRCAIQYHEPFGKFDNRGVFVTTPDDARRVNDIANIAFLVVEEYTKRTHL